MSKPNIENITVGLVFATISRPHVAQRLISSVRKYFPDIPIYVSDQSNFNVSQDSFYRQNNCQVVWMEHDAGVSASRNAAVALVKEEFFVLCDDDFIITAETNFKPALKILSLEPDIGVVGGRLIDIYINQNGKEYRDQRFWEMMFFFDPQKGKLTTIPAHYFAPDPKKIDGERYFECDSVMNFAVLRTEMIDDVIRWDPQFKSNGEHEDFYLNLKVNGNYRVVYSPSVVAHHHHPSLQSYSRLRNRSHGWQVFLQKWSLRQFLEIDGGLRIINNVHQVHPYAIGYERFYTSPPLTLVQPKRRKDRLLVSNVTNEILDRSIFNKLDYTEQVASDFRRFEVDLQGSVTVIEDTKISIGSKPSSLVPNAKISDYDIDAFGINFEVLWPEHDLEKNDAFVYIFPRLPKAYEIEKELINIDFLDVIFSISVTGSSLKENIPALTYKQDFLLNHWNALAIPMPKFSGDVSVELIVYMNGNILFTSSKSIAWFSPESHQTESHHLVQDHPDSSKLISFLFHPDGRPIKILQMILFRNPKQPRKIFRRVVFKKNGKPRILFRNWMSS